MVKTGIKTAAANIHNNEIASFYRLWKRYVTPTQQRSRSVWSFDRNLRVSAPRGRGLRRNSASYRKILLQPPHFILFLIQHLRR